MKSSIISNLAYVLYGWSPTQFVDSKTDHSKRTLTEMKLTKKYITMTFNEITRYHSGSATSESHDDAHKNDVSGCHRDEKESQ